MSYKKSLEFAKRVTKQDPYFFTAIGKPHLKDSFDAYPCKIDLDEFCLVLVKGELPGRLELLCASQTRASAVLYRLVQRKWEVLWRFDMTTMTSVTSLPR